MERNSYSSSTNVDSDPFDQSSFYSSSSIYLFSLGTIFSLSSTITRFLFPASSSYTADEKLDDSHIKSSILEEPTSLDTKNRYPGLDVDEDWLQMNEVAAVMEKMGMPISAEEDALEIGEEIISLNCSRSVLTREELYRMFDEREPSLDEVKASFEVFDQNSDGFIDAYELKRVLCILGLRHDVEACRMMIRAVNDEDGDDRMGFNQFFKFMQKNFC